MRERIRPELKEGCSAHRVSVAMATFNGGNYIGEQLDSIARQEMLPIELVITDDGSTDGTLEVVEAFARKAPFPVRLFRNETRLGYADNFLRAASLCEGDLIAFCDQDDIWHERKLAICSRFFEDSHVQLVAHSAQTISEAGKAGYYPMFSKTRIWGPFGVDPFANHPGFSMVIRKDILLHVDSKLRPDRLRSHDHWIWFLAACSGTVATIGQPLTIYRQHGRNLYGAPRRRLFAERVASVVTTLGYDQTSDEELAAANVLSAAGKTWLGASEQLNRSAKLLTLRSKLHRLRAQIYKRESNFLGRAAAFTRIALMGGYCPDRSKTRLGPRAALKDLLFGVPAIYKLFVGS
jgi:hypothetical protein